MSSRAAGRVGQPGAALACLLGVLFLTFLDLTIVSVALGSIQFHLGAGVIPLQWVLNAYALVFASLMLMAGALGDRYGRRTVMLVGIAIFCIGSLGCALAPSVGWVIAGRAVMGSGAAASEPGTLSVIRQLYPDPAVRARALGAWAAVSGLALALGPVLGGLLVRTGDWRSVFWFNLAFGLVMLFATARLVPNSADPSAAGIDRAGFVLGTTFLAAFVYAGISGEQYGYRTWWIVALFVLSAAALVGFVLVESRTADPMLDLHYLRDRTTGTALFVAFAVYFGVFSIFFLTALYLDVVIGYSGTRMAGVFAPMAAATVLGSLAAGRWVARRGPKQPMIAGCLCGAGGILAARFLLTATPSYPGLMVALAVAGAGFGIAVVPLTSAVLGRVPAQRSGMAASATNTARQLGAVVGVAALGAIVNGFLTHDFGQSLTARGTTGSSRQFVLNLLETGGDAAKGVDIAHPPPIIKNLVEAATAAFRTGLHAALAVAAVLVLVAAAMSARLPRTSKEAP